jgi:hypothetical protein
MSEAYLPVLSAAFSGRAGWGRGLDSPGIGNRTTRWESYAFSLFAANDTTFGATGGRDGLSVRPRLSTST